MNHGLYIAAAGLKSRSQTLEVAANNMANASVAGYKRDMVFYNIFNRVEGSPLERALADSVVVEEASTDFSAGPLQRTDNPLDLALAADGFFAVQTEQGVRYTRNGQFTIDSDRRLVNQMGQPLLNDNDRPIVLPPQGQIQVGSRGDVSVDGVLAGRIQIVDFADKSQLTKTGGVLFQAAEGAEAQPPQNLSVKQGFLERSNVNPVDGLADALHNMRTFEMLARAMRMMSRDVDQKAINEIARV
ncbi:MAG TPA: flagellar basal-body rod protein FlgF [Acidobacteriota bacterium]|nr:flagellar basal-body rod protein FlgF [Acidobacteriota bacterium]